MTIVNMGKISDIVIQAGQVVVVTNDGAVYSMRREEIINMMSDFVFEVDEQNDMLINGERCDQ